MITLYDKLETDFQHNGIGSLDQNIIDPKIHWIDNGVFSFEFEYPLFAKHGLEITNSTIIKARDPEQDNLFFVYKVVPSMGYIKVYAYQMFYKLAFNTINDTNIVHKNGQGALTQMAGATQYPHKFKFTSDIASIANSRVVRKNPVEFLLDSNLDNSFVNRWGGHIVRHGFNISLDKAYGSNKGYKIQHKKDLLGYEATIDETTVVTRIRPVGYDGLLLPEIYIDSPLVNNYPEPRIQEYIYSDVKVGTGEGEFAIAALAYAELRRLAKLEFSQNKIDVPRGAYKIDFVNLKETEEYKNFAPLKQILPGDIVSVKHEEDGIDISAQMVEYNWNPLLKEYIDLTLGNYERSFTSTVSKLDKIQTDLKDLNNQIELVYLSANGKNQIYTGETEPVIDQNSTEGDMWIRINGDKKELWFLRKINSELQWVVEISDATQEELKSLVKSTIEQADTDRAKSEQDFETSKQLAKQYTDAEVLKFDTKFTAETGAIRNEVQTGYANAVATGKAYTDTKSNEFNSQLGLVKTDVASTVIKADAAVLKADKAISDAGFAKVDADTAKQNALTAVGTAGTALSTAQTAISNSGTALTNAQNALNAYNNLEIDGRNLYVYSKGISAYYPKVNSVSLTKMSFTIQGTYPPLNFALDLKSFSKLEKDVRYTFSGFMYLNGNPIPSDFFSVRNTLNNQSNYNTVSLEIDSLTGFFSWTFYSNIDRDSGYDFHTTLKAVVGDIVDIEYLKVEKGTKPSPWKSAPEDVQVQITDINGELARKVSQTTFDTLNGVVGTHTTQIGQTQIALTAKADSQLVNTIKGTVDKHTLDIAATSKGLTFKADSSLVDTIKGTVDQHTTELGIQAQAITARLTSTQVDSLVAGKNFVNQTTLNATSTGLTAQITQVSNLVNDIGVWEKTYSANTATPAILTKLNGDSLDDTESYEIQGIVNPTGTVTTAIVVFQSKGNKGTGWNLIKISEKGISSNHPEFFIDINGNPSVRMYNHTTKYNVEVTHRAYKGMSTPLIDSEFKYTILNATIDGIQSTVGNKADKTQVTQLANQWTQTTALVTGHTGQISNLGAQVDLRVVKGDVIGQITLEAGRTLIKNGQLLLDADTYIMGTTFANDIKAKSLESVYADIATLRTKFLIVDLITSAYLKVDNALVDKMTATTAIVDRFFSKTAVIDNVEAKSLSAVYADIPTIRNKVLITDSVTAGMVKADAGLFDKVFINDAAVQKLTAKSSFINSVKAVDITADKITGGIFNAALMTVIGLNASDITSGTLTGANFKLNLSTGQMDVTGSKQTVRLSSSGLTMLNNSNQEVGRFITGYGSASSDNGLLVGISPNKAFTIGKQNSDNGAYIDVIKVRYDKDLIDINYPIDKLMIGKPTYNIEIGSDNLLAHNAEYGFRFSRYNATTNGNDGILELRAKNITSWADWNFNGWTMKNVNLEPNSINSSGSISTNGSLNVNSGSKTAQLFFGSTEAYLSADYGVVIAHKDASGSNRAVMTFTYNNITSWANINMNGRSVTNQSDRRLKKNILNSSDDSLGAINRWKFVNYEWISSEKPSGIKLGLIAQDTPELSIYDADSDVYSIDSSKQMMMNSQAIQQLNKKVVSIESIANASISFASQALSETQKLKQEVQELKQKIKQLESAV